MTIWIKFVICKFKGHKLIHAGSCPYTGSDYDLCTYCEAMIPRQVAV